MTQPSTAFLEALPAGHAPADRGSNMDLSGSLIGCWVLDVSAHLRDGSTRRQAGRATRRATSRCTEQPCAPMTQIDAWHIQWTVPVTQSYFSMISLRQGRDVVRLVKTESGQLMRWCFSQIGPQFFNWRGSFPPPMGRSGPPTWNSARGALPWCRKSLAWRLTRLPSFPSRARPRAPA
jgi:hypothetical protein